MILIQTLLAMIVAYLLGSIPFSYLVARTRGVDLRSVGSGNIGGANVWRSCGFGHFLVAVSLDLLKGTVPALVAFYILELPALSVILTGGSAMLGHTFSPFMRFRGGKAVATSAGVLLAIFPQSVLIGATTWFVTVAITRISSVGSLMAAGAVFIAAVMNMALERVEPAYALFACLAAVVVVLLHRNNIQRLLEGTENRVQKF